MYSSDEEFVWSRISNDESDSEVEMPYDGEPESDKSYKKKLLKQLVENGELDLSAQTEAEAEAEEPRKRKKKHKRERSPRPPSPSPSLTPAPRVKSELPADGLDDSATAAEHILKMKVKEERVSFVAPRDSPRKRRASSGEPDHRPKKKKKKMKEEREFSTAEAVDGAESPRKKKKRKRDSERTSVGDRDLIIDKFEAEETVVEQRPKVNGHARKEKLEQRPQVYTSKEFIEDEDSSGEDSERPAARGGGADAESPRKARVSERISFELQSESDCEPPPKTVEKPQESSKRARKTSERQSESSRRARKTSEKQANGERTQSIPERITFEESQPESESPKRAQRISERITFEESQSESEPPEQARRVSDRITFEESQSDSGPESGRGEAGAGVGAGAGGAGGAPRLARYLRAHAHLQPAAGALPPGAGVAADEDAWLLRAPAGLPAAALRGATLAVDARGKLKVGGRAYEAAPAGGPGRVALLAPARGGGGLCVRAVALRGTLRLRARLPRPHAPPAAGATSPERIPLPETRLRHPLLGAGYERAAELAPAVRRRLAAAARRAPDGDEADAAPGDASEPRERKKKKKKHKERPEPREEAPEAEELKKRKRKHSSRHEADPGDSDSQPRKKKVKKEKKDKTRRDDVAWDSERAIEESLFNF